MQNAQHTMQKPQCTMHNEQCTMHNAQCTMQNAECKMQNATCIMQNAKSKMHNAECRMQLQNAKCKQPTKQHAPSNVSSVHFCYYWNYLNAEFQKFANSQRVMGFGIVKISNFGNQEFEISKLKNQKNIFSNF